MKCNMGKTDRIVRVVIGMLLILVLIYFHETLGWLGIILGIIAAVNIVTAMMGVCLLYMPFGFDTRCKDKKK